jgi:hypothetical protein
MYRRIVSMHFVRGIRESISDSVTAKKTAVRGLSDYTPIGESVSVRVIRKDEIVP